MQALIRTRGNPSFFSVKSVSSVLFRTAFLLGFEVVEKWCGLGWDCQGCDWDFMKKHLFFLEFFWIISNELLLFWVFDAVYGEMVWI